ncbi:hypothetical protein N7492_000140 [Penicillium capsulatum]|uniref:Mmc1 C-terminal domain-containing protein n=1 Tax=Penicillium capsulatum TaxID=69766 RepID=A0A9W9IR71_9EURO|nr:hypothetical protein N7492_000140 [Penicillium capsulatum]KAJ6130794.1 hypothetical protein N7512_003574 [Penicillium capsulatum]
MPARMRSALSRSLARPLESAGVFFCPSCSIWRRTLSTRANTAIASVDTARRAARPLAASSPSHSTPIRLLATNSAITAGKTVPPRFRELYDALSGVKDAAIEQVSVSRLQLALRGLESETPLVRVAVLGLDTADSARRLVRLLLADPLSPRENWEDLLEGLDPDSSRGLLIRYEPLTRAPLPMPIPARRMELRSTDWNFVIYSYGEVSESVPNDLLPTITIRSPLLKRGNLEILVSSLGSESDSTGTTLAADTFLVPTVTIQTSHSGRHNVVRYPVHRSLVCGSGVDGLLAFSTLMGQSDLKNEVASVRGAIDLSVADHKSSGDRLSFVDIDRAGLALDKIRESVQNATEYERGWNTSGVQPMVDWLGSFSQAVNSEALNPALIPLVESLLNSAEEGLRLRDAKAAHDQTIGVTPEAVRAELERGVAVWAERAHSELRSGLEAGFASPRWRGLAWWKLFWRVDDVSMITSEIVEKRLLRRAEREVIWTSGRYEQAGLLAEPDRAPKPTDAGAIQSSPPPWPTRISDMRTKLLGTTVPSLQALAQRLVLFSVSTTTLASALSALTYISVPSASVYESGTLAAVGLIYSLRRQQKKWDVARGFWEDEVREEGRSSLRDTQEHLQRIVRDGGKTQEDVSDQGARDAIDRARKALKDVHV